MVSHRRYFLDSSAVYAVFWAALAIDPHDRGDRALENVLVVVAAVLLFFTYKRVLLLRISYTLMFIFPGLHAIDAHWTYSLVPYEDEIARLLREREKD